MESLAAVRDYPPLYTLQPNLDVRGRQLAMWRKILVESKQYIFDVSSKVFSNPTIDRKLNSAFFSELADYLIKEKSAIWLVDKTRLLFLPVTLEAYADALTQWAQKNGAGNSVETIFHIQQTSKGFAFDEAPEELVIAAARVLESRGKCKVLKEGQGVRFNI